MTVFAAEAEPFIQGAKTVFVIPLFGGIAVTETIVNMWIIMAIIVALCIFLTRKMTLVPTRKRQLVAEQLVSMLNNFVKSTMGEKHLKYAPYIGTLFTISILGSLSSLTGIRPYTGDISVTLGWALVTFFMVLICNIRSKGILGYLKSFVEPVPIMLPINIVGEIANPISMSFRHFGNIVAGMVITKLIYSALGSLLGAGSIPILQLGIPAILSIYFDLFTSFLQAYIICMLTMVFVSSANEA